MVPGRLAVSEVTVDLPASMRSERHQAVRDCALEWQRFSSEAWFWEMASPEAVENAAYALAGQMASVGEQVALAYSAAVEVALWQTKPAVEEDSVVREMSIRAMAEAQSLFVIGAGHALANVAVRALTVRADLKARLAALFQPKAADGFAPFSQKREDWISLNTPACKKLAAAAASSKSRDIIALVAAVVNYGNSPEWRALVERRGEDFHRWRPQTHGLPGISQRSPWAYVPPTANSPGERVLQMGQLPYEDAHGLAGEVAQVATDGMFALAEGMVRFTNGLEAAMRALRDSG